LQDITKNTQEKIYLQVFNDGVLVQADTNPTLQIFDADNDSVPIPGFSALTAYDESPAGVYSFLLTPAITNLNRVLEVKWTYSLNGVVATQTEFYQVESVYASSSDIIDFLGFGSTPSELNYHDIKEIQSAEKLARTIVDGYTGQKFINYYGTQEQFGKGADAIEFVEKMIVIDKMYENDILVIDNTVTPVFNQFGFNLELTPTGFGARLIDPGWDVRYDNAYDPNILYYGKFRDNSRYAFQGTIGYKYVPEDIKIATILLVNDILSNDYNWRVKYLSKVDLSEISFEMHKGAFNGTGNLNVDNILDQYRHVNIVII
jgi:hypothetical protein